LRFWFNRNPGLALPLIALQYHDVQINLTLANVQDCYWASGASRVPGDLVDVSLWVDYIYLDTDERRRFAQAAHEYLIEQLQYTGDIPVQSTTEILKMAFTVKKNTKLEKTITPYLDARWLTNRAGAFKRK
jgi:hypothetical protein